MEINERSKLLRKVVGYLREIPELERTARDGVIRNDYFQTFIMSRKKSPNKPSRSLLSELIIVGKSSRHFRNNGAAPKSLESYTLNHPAINDANELYGDPYRKRLLSQSLLGSCMGSCFSWYIGFSGLTAGVAIAHQINTNYLSNPIMKGLSYALLGSAGLYVMKKIGNSFKSIFR